MKNIQIALADDHKVLRMSLSKTLDREPNITVAFEADNGKIFIEKLKKSAITLDIALLDLDMPEMSGYETAKFLLKHYPELKIMILSMHRDDAHILELIEMGVCSYVSKDTEYEDLLKHIQDVMTYGSSFSREIVAIMRDTALAEEKDDKAVISVIVLNKRERDVLTMVCQGLTNKEIAKQLSLSSRTVERYRQDLLAKFGVKRPVGLLLKAMQQNLIDIKRF